MNTNIRPAFNDKDVRILLKPETMYNESRRMQQIFVSVDPAAGGSKSKYAIISCIYVNKSKMVVSILCVFIPEFRYHTITIFHPSFITFTSRYTSDDIFEIFI